MRDAHHHRLRRCSLESRSLRPILLLALSGITWCGGGCGQGVQSEGTNGTSARDTDSDGWPDELDNCPGTANASQADSNQDGVGDGCEGFAFAEMNGVLQMKVDDRLRPSGIFAGEDLISLMWPDDASHATMVLTGQTPGVIDVPMDFSDAGVLAALDNAQANGQDVSSLRQFVMENPGRIERIVRGEEAAPDPALKPILGNVLQAIDPDVAEHLARLAAAAALSRSMAYRLNLQLGVSVDAGEQAVLRALVPHFVRLANLLLDERTYQEQECIECLPGNDCAVACSRPVMPLGACCTDGACAEMYLDQCPGTFNEGASCSSSPCDMMACYFSENNLTHCECIDTSRAACIELRGNGRPGTCADNPCGACCVISDASGDESCYATHQYQCQLTGDAPNVHVRFEAGQDCGPGNTCPPPQ